ncbi:MAG TPA: GH32 C-terminal domain-containing protein [Verrucomicrobiales bacterium]|nr:GH32 C-terminal domain-containing protein [Verrucomicrobiales bacterium]
MNISTRSGLWILTAALFAGKAALAQEGSYNEPYRPQFHFTPPKNWMNDPNGLVYFDGEYHLFYQYNPSGDRWGHMSWGHAVSRDLVHWEHLPVALPEEDGVMIFSGSAVVDVHNTSGFGQGGKAPLVAIYTGRRNEDNRQHQSLAYSNDRGRTWTKYEENPVLDIGSTDFRDPKVFRYPPGEEGDGRWIMVLALSVERKVSFYASDNLREWEHLSDFGPAGATEGIWECPDLFPLEVDDGGSASGRERKWVLEVDLGSGSVAGGSGGQYFIGDFDGRSFVPDEEAMQVKTVPEFVPEGRVLYDFEGESYHGWTVEGGAFGEGPARGTLDGQNPVSGFRGGGLVNSFRGGDAAIGRMVSPPFLLSADYLSFLIGGGSHAGQTCMNLSVDGRVVRTATGADSETLAWQSWDVSEWVGREAVLEIVDDHRGGWGHINVDEIVIAEEPPRAGSEAVLWVDYGSDFYAAVTWSGVPAADGRTLWIGWMSNWQYAQDVPTSPWRSAQSVARELGLRRTANGALRLLQRPVRELTALRDSYWRVTNRTAKETSAWLAEKGARGPELEIVAEFEARDAAKFGILVRRGPEEETAIGYRVDRREIYVDRTKSGKAAVHPVFPAVHAAPLEAADGRLQLRVLVDRGSIEVFANDGETVITDLIFPQSDSDGIEVFSRGGEAMVREMDVWRLRSTWR